MTMTCKVVSLLLVAWAASVAADPVPLVFWHGMGKYASELSVRHVFS